ncbi:RagB/SusD family nutrient uptake outer membrane protein [Sinomicrobium soli]|uniref:RagB/SusD family nutrient uptake outer membrane protein n=1 Tax=Sinomicrobium sp. N-1-3-6 TaxID=2219864 RepID=UPI000DCE302F|nr:RagB/SusD family nutrient uptake outer membrane protein [Sinomicrobium sp. N-1-3-6]RAV30303.1 RagB/SusD family nutrient uptake outer membrane protein [Sinomicrobium sp. N-1-3-6]
MRKTAVYKYVAGLLCFGAIVSGCEKDYLDVDPTDRVSDAAILTDSVLFEAYVVNRYLGAKVIGNEGDAYQPGFGRGFEYAMWSSITDESIYNNDDNSWLVQQGQLSPENLGMAGAVWSRSYRSIREVNYALTHIEELEMSTERTERLRAELRFIRAFRYHDIIRNYGKAVLIGDRVSSLDDDLTDPFWFDRRPIAECMAYVLGELEEIAPGLPLNNSGEYPEGRATRGAALALKSRLALYAASPLYNDGAGDSQKWAAAAQAASEVMDLGIYSLYPDYQELFTAESSNGEYIFARFYNLNARHLALEIANGPNGYGGWGGNIPLQNLVDDYEMEDGTAFSWDNPEHAEAPYENRDPRFYATILYNGASYRGRSVETFVPGGRDSQEGNDNWNTSKSGYYLNKFIREDLPIINPWDVAGVQNWIYFRYGEILLNYAEAQNEAVGPDESVYSAVNAIRNRPGVEMPALPEGLSQSEMRERIRHERRIELAFEEHRFYDVRRWMIADETENEPAYGITITKNTDGSLEYERKTALEGKSFSEQHYWLPIPRTEILASDNQLEQNPFY